MLCHSAMIFRFSKMNMCSYRKLELAVKGFRKPRPDNLSKRLIFTDIQSVPNLIQNIVGGLHAVTGLSWSSTLALSTVVVRIGLLPLYRYQMVLSANLGKALPELNFLCQLVVNRLVECDSHAERYKIISVFLKGCGACLVQYDVKPLQLIVYPAINTIIFITFVYSLRDMIERDPFEEFKTGGFLWFEDLTVKDKTFFLPLTAITVSYSAVEIAFLGIVGSTPVFLKDLGQMLLIVMIPFVVPLPCGIFFYWIPSSLFGIVQGLMFKNPSVRQFLRIPTPPTAKHLQKSPPSGGTT